MLCCAVLCCAVLCCAVLCCAVLCCAVLCCAVLCCWQRTFANAALPPVSRSTSRKCEIVVCRSVPLPKSIWSPDEASAQQPVINSIGTAPQSILPKQSSKAHSSTAAQHERGRIHFSICDVAVFARVCRRAGRKLTGSVLETIDEGQDSFVVRQQRCTNASHRANKFAKCVEGQDNCAGVSRVQRRCDGVHVSTHRATQ
jgi:hypothetical protein